MDHFSITEDGDHVGAVGEGIGRHAGNRNAGGHTGWTKGRVGCCGAPATDEIDVQRIGAAAQIGDELVVGSVGQNIVKAEGHRIVATTGQDPLHVDDAGSPQVDYVGVGPIGIHRVEV